MSGRGVAEDVLLHPATVVALALLLLNDRYLRWSHPGVVTGKLSDVAGLVLFPLLVVGLIERVRRRTPVADRIALTIVAMTGLGFAALKLVAPVTEGYRVAMGAIQYPLYAITGLAGGGGWPEVRRVEVVADPTDLVALVALVVPVAVLQILHRSWHTATVRARDRHQHVPDLLP